ncbi:MAG: beta-galactosidase [Bacillus sp. (in: Bacteria)]|nr:beta-galactosidase [Bacillus sp. (in: firmicutes)]
MKDQKPSPDISMDFGEKFRCKGRPFYLISGEFPYYRMNPSYWADRLAKVREMGIKVLSFYVPWRLHMPSPEIIDLSGSLGDGRRDIKGFTHLAASMGFSLIAKVGPFMCGEYRRGGIPDWLMESYPEVTMRDSTGREVVFFQDGLALPDLLHPVVINYVKIWYQKLAEELLLPLQQKGALSAVQIENEFPFSTMSLADPFSWGYTEHHQEGFRSFRASRRKCVESSLPTQNMMLCSEEDWRIYRDWVEYKEDVAAEILSIYSSFLRNVGVEIPFYHDLIMLENESPTNFRKMARVLPICPNFWFEKHPKYDYENYARAIIRAKLAQSVQKNRVIYASETNWSWGSEEEFSFLMMVILPYLSGLNIYCVVDGDDTGKIGDIPLSNVPEPYPGCAPIDVNGHLRKAFYTVKHLIEFFEEENGECGAELAEAHELTSVALCNYTPYNYPSLLKKWANNKHVELANLFFFLPDMNSWLIGMAERLIETNIGFDIIDLECVNANELESYEIIFTPTFRYMDEFIQKHLISYVEKGGTLFIFPDLPSCDVDLHPCSLIKSTFFPDIEFFSLLCYINLEWKNFGNIGTVLSNVNLAHVPNFNLKQGVNQFFSTEAFNWDGTPIGLLSRYGLGEVYWFGAKLYEFPKAASLLAWLCRKYKKTPLITIKAETIGCCDDDLHVRLFATRNNSHFIFVMNRSNHNFIGAVEIVCEKLHQNVKFNIEIPAKRGLIIRYNHCGIKNVFYGSEKAKINNFLIKKLF